MSNPNALSSELEFCVTMSCNLGCTYCYENHYSKKIDVEKSKKAIEEELLFHVQNKPSEKLIIPVAGGEVFMALDVTEELLLHLIDKYAELNLEYKDNLMLSIVTNGTLISRPKSVEFIEKYKKYLRINVSIDGIKEAQDTARITKQGSSSFDNTVEGIRTAQKLLGKENVGVNLVASKTTLRYLSRSLKFLCSLEPRRLKINMASETFSYSDSILLANELMDFVDWYILNNCSIFVRGIFNHNLEDFVLEQHRFQLKTQDIDGYDDVPICLGKHITLIGVDSKKYHCLGLHALKIDKEEANKIIDNAEYWSELEPEKCRTCFVKNQVVCDKCLRIPFEQGARDKEAVKKFYENHSGCGVTKAHYIVRQYISSKYTNLVGVYRERI